MKEKKLAQYASFDKDPVIRYGFAAAILVWLASTLGVILIYATIPPVIPLFYSIARGPQQLAPKLFLSLLPVMSLVFLVTHLIFAWVSYSQDQIFARIMTVSASLVTFMLALAGAHILWIVL